MESVDLRDMFRVGCGSVYHHMMICVHSCTTTILHIYCIFTLVMKAADSKNVRLLYQSVPPICTVHDYNLRFFSLETIIIIMHKPLWDNVYLLCLV